MRRLRLSPMTAPRPIASCSAMHSILTWWMKFVRRPTATSHWAITALQQRVRQQSVDACALENQGGHGKRPSRYRVACLNRTVICPLLKLPTQTVFRRRWACRAKSIFGMCAFEQTRCICSGSIRPRQCHHAVGMHGYQVRPTAVRPAMLSWPYLAVAPQPVNPAPSILRFPPGWARRP